MAKGEGATVRDMLHTRARWFPGNEAVVDSSQRYTYAQLLDQVQRMAAIYYSLGVRKGDRVALMLYPSANHPIALFGAMELGAIPVGLHVMESPQVLAEILKRISPRVLVYDVNFTEKVDHLRKLVPTITGFIRGRSAVSDPRKFGVCSDPLFPDDLAKHELDFEPVPVAEDDPAVIILSSGTTATPKGIVHTHRTLVESARGGMYMFHHIKPTDSLLSILPTGFSGWYWLSLPFLNAGAKVIYISQWDPQAYVRTLQDEQATVALLIPTMWRLLLQQDLDKFDLKQLRLAGFSGEVMDPATLTQVRDRITPHVMNMYGSTETGACSGTILFEEDMLQGKLESVGKPMINADIRVIQPDGNPEDVVEPGEVGEIITRGPSVAKMVWDDAVTTRRLFRGPWYYTGDLGRLDGDGYLYLEGRKDDMIISGGINVMPARVEEVLLGHPSIAMAAVVGVPDPVWGKRVKAFVVRKDKSLTTETLEAFVLQSELTNYQRPRELVFVDELPRTATGKVNRRELRKT